MTMRKMRNFTCDAAEIILKASRWKGKVGEEGCSSNEESKPEGMISDWFFKSSSPQNFQVGQRTSNSDIYVIRTHYCHVSTVRWSTSGDVKISRGWCH
ncbi:hypothetical protein BDR04DRAFT_1111241 [Suillus decipiens]|nr:hypothetical protein BDR04DRAFT_1111241 [Suillus decipiens]